MAKKQFKAESKRLLDLMINSIYTNKEIFLREIISNASDAMDKLAYLAVTDGSMNVDRGDLKITITRAKDAGILTVSDNGSGIPPEVLERLNSHELIPGGHLGLNNVDRIVRLSYGESCGLSAYPNEGGGSCVQLRLPMQKGEDHAQGTDR